MNSEKIRKTFLSFFEDKDHKVIPSASLVPENDPSVLFTTAGMQPLAPYLLGETHPLGKRLVNVQKCIRTGDIDAIGDNTHLTFFEMMGNWSLGDYFKNEAIGWSFELLTSKERGFGLDPRRLYVTVFEGDENAPKDDESFNIWKEIFDKNGVAGERIYFMGAKSNWWSAGGNGPCGPDTEMFYDLTGSLTSGMTKEEYLKADEEQRVVEIWNNVFMEYEKKNGKVIGRLPQKNVDTGSGLERVTSVIQGKNSVFETDLFLPIIQKIQSISKTKDMRAERIIADHLRTAVFMIADGVNPSNTDRGYVLRRLIRRAVRYTDLVNMEDGGLKLIIETIQSTYKNTYPEITLGSIISVITEEEQKFRKTLQEGLKQFEKFIPQGYITGANASMLAFTFGLPKELTIELAQEKGLEFRDEGEFEEELKKHRELSRAGSEQKFKGGLANTSEQTIKLHTAHHLLLSALQKVLGKEVKQKGSNITEERLRIDFSFSRKLTPDELNAVENIVNEHIKSDLPVIRREMHRIEAETLGAEMEFGTKYPEIVSIYFIEDKDGNAVSKEFCGGPHVKNTGVLGKFKIQKEESVSAGIRRIKATLT